MTWRREDELLRLLRRAMPAAIVLAVFVQGDALAATKTVDMVNFAFSPKMVSIAAGSTIHWANNSGSVHTSTGDTPLALWDSGTVNNGGSFDFVFTAGGKYPYHCTFHVGLGMTGTVSVTIRATPPSGPVGTMFTITVASVTAPAGFVYDIQKKNPGGQFQNWMLGVTAKSVVFDSTGQATGTYGFRSRLHRLSDNATSAYSAAKNIMVT
jgi:plastocyanin